MGTFKDTTGREWTITLTIGSLKRIRSIAGLDLMPLFGGQDKQESEAVRTLLLDPMRMADVVYAALKPQLDEAQINDEAFGELLAGPVLAAAAEAKGVRLLAVDAEGLAREAGTARAVNVALMGATSTVMPFAAESWQQGLTRAVPAKIFAVNERAFALGRDSVVTAG